MSPSFAPGEHERRHHERVGRDRELHALDRRVEVRDDLRDRHVHDAAVEHHHELRRREDRERDPPAGLAVGGTRGLLVLHRAHGRIVRARPRAGNGARRCPRMACAHAAAAARGSRGLPGRRRGRPRGRIRGDSGERLCTERRSQGARAPASTGARTAGRARARQRADKSWTHVGRRAPPVGSAAMPDLRRVAKRAVRGGRSSSTATRSCTARGRGPARRAHPRHGQLVAPLAWRRAAAGRAPHRDRARPARPRRLGDAPRRLLARRPRARASATCWRRSASTARRSSGTRSAAGSRCSSSGSSPARRAPRAGLQRRPRARGRAAAAHRRAARRLRADLAGRRTTAVLGGLTRAARACASAATGRRAAAGDRPRAAPAGAAGRPRGVRAHAARGDRRARPARQRDGPALPARARCRR